MANEPDCQCGHAHEDHKEDGNWSACEKCGCINYTPETSDADE